MTFVFNASPLIVLAKADLLETVLQLPQKVLIPDAVALEIQGCDDVDDPASVWLQNPQSNAFIHNSPLVSEFVAAWGLGAGESSVISLTKTLPDAIAVLDDLAARRCATALGLSVTGTLGLLLRAKREGLIEKVAPALDAIVHAGIYISERHLHAIREKAGEA